MRAEKRSRVPTHRGVHIRIVLLAAAALALSGCRTTKVWKRGTLAKKVMAPDGDGSREALRHHILSTREGAVGGFGGGGGGCGCN